MKNLLHIVELKVLLFVKYLIEDTHTILSIGKNISVFLIFIFLFLFINNVLGCLQLKVPVVLTTKV